MSDKEDLVGFMEEDVLKSARSCVKYVERAAESLKAFRGKDFPREDSAFHTALTYLWSEAEDLFGMADYILWETYGQKTDDALEKKALGSGDEMGRLEAEARRHAAECLRLTDDAVSIGTKDGEKFRAAVTGAWNELEPLINSLGDLMGVLYGKKPPEKS